MPRRRYLWHRTKETATGKVAVFVYIVFDPDWNDERYDIEVVETTTTTVDNVELAYKTALDILSNIPKIEDQI